MNMILLNEVQALNLDHVVDAKYTPEHDGKQAIEYFHEGQYTQKSVPHHFVSKLEITTTAGSASKVIVLSGNDADVMWKYIESKCDVPILE